MPPKKSNSQYLNTHYYDGKIKHILQNDILPIKNEKKINKLGELKEMVKKVVEKSKGKLNYLFNNTIFAIDLIIRDIINPNNYDPTNKVYAHDLLYLVTEIIQKDQEIDVLPFLMEQLVDILHQGSCAQGRCTRIYQIYISLEEHKSVINFLSAKKEIINRDLIISDDDDEPRCIDQIKSTPPKIEPVKENFPSSQTVMIDPQKNNIIPMVVIPLETNNYQIYKPEVAKVDYQDHKLILTINNIDNFDKYQSFGVHFKVPFYLNRYSLYNQYECSFTFSINKPPETSVRFFDGNKWSDLFEPSYQGKFNFTSTSRFRIGFKNLIKLSTIEISNPQLSLEKKITQKMIVILGGTDAVAKDLDKIDLTQLNSFSSVYTYYLRKYLHHSISIPTAEIDKTIDNLPECQHLLDLNLSNYCQQHRELENKFREKITGKICVLHDYNNPKKYGFEDCFFYSYDKKIINNNHSFKIGWGTDSELFKPNKINAIIKILICYTSENIEDHESTQALNTILMSLIPFIKDNKKYQVIRFGCHDASINYHDPYQGFCSNYSVEKNLLPLAKRAELFNQSHIYIASRKESLGFPVLEAAMSGNLIVTPQDFIHPNLLNDLYHFNLDLTKPIPWGQIISFINPENSRKMSLACTWENIIKKITDQLNNKLPF